MDIEFVPGMTKDIQRDKTHKERLNIKSDEKIMKLTKGKKQICLDADNGVKADNLLFAQRFQPDCQETSSITMDGSKAQAK